MKLRELYDQYISIIRSNNLITINPNNGHAFFTDAAMQRVSQKIGHEPYSRLAAVHPADNSIKDCMLMLYVKKQNDFFRFWLESYKDADYEYDRIEELITDTLALFGLQLYDSQEYVDLNDIVF